MNLGVIRLSDLKGDAQTGPVRQKESITAKFAQLGVEPEDITWAEDLDVSAFHVPPLKRPHLRRAFNALPNGSKVIFYRLDRFVRRVFPDFSDMISFAADHKLTLYSATEELDLLRLDGMMVATLLAFVAQKESENTSARVKNTQEYFRKTGRWKGALVPYGYHPVRVDGKPGWWLELDPEIAGLLREVIQRVIAGHSVNAVAAWLNDQGVLPPIDRARALQDPPKPRLCLCGHDQHDEPCAKIHKCHHRKRVDGKNLKLHEYDECSQPCPEYEPRMWRRESLQEILRSPALCGYTVENKNQIFRDDTGMPVSFAPGVIDFDTFQQLQAHLDSRQYRKIRTQSPSLLLNVAYCDCGAPLYLANKVRQLTTGEKIFEYYRHRTGSCPGTRVIPVARLDALVQRELLKSFGMRMVLRKEKGDEHEAEFQAERRSVSSQIMELTQDMYVRGRPRENHNELMAGLQARHAELTAALESETEPEVRWVETDETFAEKWEAMDTVGRRLWLMDAGVRVVAVRGRMPPVEFISLPKGKRSLITASEDDLYAVIYLGNFGEILRRVTGHTNVTVR